MVKHATANDADAYNWFCGVLDGKANKLCPFDILFMQNGERLGINTQMTITISLPTGYATPQMYYVDNNGNITLIDTTITGDKISFKTDHNSSCCESMSQHMKITISYSSFL